jgi:Zn-dependent peptidase ImmA (M78 family)
MRAVDKSPEKNEEPIAVLEPEAGKILIEYPTDVKMRPYIRYRIAKAMAGYFLKKHNVMPVSDNAEHSAYIAEVQANLFAAKLLTPAYLIRKELANLDAAKDIVTQLADVFWMSKTFMNGRLKEILEKSAEI